MLVNRQTFRNFVSNEIIACSAAYAHTQDCIHAFTAPLTLVHSPAYNSLKRLCDFDKNKCLTRK